MIPLYDDIPARRTPIVNYTLITINILAFLWEVSLGARLDLAIGVLGVVPARFLAEPGPERWIPVLISMFLHGGAWHLGSNMLALWIFGDNVEDRLGPFGYLIFYLICGLLATLAHIYTNPTSTVPSIGASGAISGVLAGYLLLFPAASVYTLFPIFLFWFEVFRIPAIIYLGIWFLSQLISGLFSLGINSVQSGGGVAWWAHVGGFLAGLILVRLFARGQPQRRYVDEYSPW